MKQAWKVVEGVHHSHLMTVEARRNHSRMKEEVASRLSVPIGWLGP